MLARLITKGYTGRPPWRSYSPPCSSSPPSHKLLQLYYMQRDHHSPFHTRSPLIAEMDEKMALRYINRTLPLHSARFYSHCITYPISIATAPANLIRLEVNLDIGRRALYNSYVAKVSHDASLFFSVLQFPHDPSATDYLKQVANKEEKGD